MTRDSRNDARRRAASVVGALPDFALAGFALITWIRPTLFGTGWVRWFVLLMLLEFIVIHSAGFLGNVALSGESRARRIRGTIFLGLFYTLFLVGFALGFRTWWPIIAFWLLILNRITGVVLGQAPSGKEKELMMRGWGAGAAIYIIAIFPTVLIPLPRLGIRRDMLGDIAGETSGLWVSEPHRAVAFAFLYFTIVGISTLYQHRWVGKGTDG